MTTVVSTEPEMIDVPEATFLTIAGAGPPSEPWFWKSMQELHEVGTQLAGVPYEEPLHGLWDGDIYDLDTIRWRLLLPVPADTPAPAGRVALERFAEGRCAQVLHVGPYEEERPTIERLHGFIDAQGVRPRGLHHEIYLSNPEAVEPSELRTIIRQPVV